MKLCLTVIRASVACFLLCGVFAGCASQEKETLLNETLLEDSAQDSDAAPELLTYQPAEDDGTWYNMPGLRSVFGDFGPASELIVDAGRSAELIDRGRYVVQNVAACGICHGRDPAQPASPLSGGRRMEDSYGGVTAANISPDRQTGIGSWSYGEIARAIRASIDRQGKPLSLELHSGYRWMSDRDVKAVVFYLKSLPPKRNAVKRRELGGLERNAWGLFPRHQELRGYVPVMPDNWAVPYGRYLATEISRCASCHTPPGGEPFSGVNWEEQQSSWSILGDFSGDADASERFPVSGPNIRGRDESGLGQWTLEQIVDYLHHGTTPAIRRSNPALCPWQHFSGMSPADKEAIANFLKTL